MELDSRNIARYFKILKYRKYKIFKTVVCYGYLFLVYIAIVYNFSYQIRIEGKPLGQFIVIPRTLGLFIAYTIINHLILRNVVSHKILLIIELLLFMTLCALWWSDQMVEFRPIEKYTIY